VNEKSQVTQEKLCSEERKRGIISGIMKEVAGQQKSIEKKKYGEVKKSNKQFQAVPGLLEGKGKLKMHSQGKPDDSGNRWAILAAR
jgi:hypothetical protein